MTFGRRVNINDPRTFRCPKCSYLAELQIVKGSDPVQCYLGCFRRTHDRLWHYFEPGELPDPLPPALAQRISRAISSAQSVHPSASRRTECLERGCSKSRNLNCRHDRCRQCCLETGRDCGVHRPAKTNANLAPDFLAGLRGVAAEIRGPVDQTIRHAYLSLLYKRQRDAALTASLPSLPPSPTKSQEERHQDYATRLARGFSTPPPSPPQPAASSSRSLLPPPSRRIVLIYWAHSGRQATISVIQDCATWVRSWPGIKLDDFAQHLSSSDTMYKFYAADYRAWIRIPMAYVQIVRTDQPFLVRRVGVVGIDEDSYISRLHTFLDFPLLPPSPLHTRPVSAATRQRPRPLEIIKIEDNDEKTLVSRKRARATKIEDDEVEIIEHPAKRGKVIEVEEDDDEVEIVEPIKPTRKRRQVSASPTPSLAFSVDTSNSTASIRSLSPSLNFLTTFYTHK
ncbi:hypothetical protein MSAN_00317200 [Mycena sanguinolenta]|uniref:Uncharacterized protein n=1 Tax=Mycena sanguinolenta TaxID=230812 RepID=A0A8H7DHB5_9AGAR|nr:hypothetical protein MSAN_00317200 [Mycena sanguinolenta]